MDDESWESEAFGRIFALITVISPNFKVFVINSPLLPPPVVSAPKDFDSDVDPQK